ncbi:hypothetical protein [Streptomyces vinaceus]
MTSTGQSETPQTIQFDRGYLSPYFINNPETNAAELDSPYVLLTKDKINDIRQLGPILEAVSKSRKTLLIIAEDVDAEALATLVVNSVRGIAKVVVVKGPGFGDGRLATLKDIANLTGGMIFSKDIGVGVEKADLEFLGTVKRAVITKDSTTLTS